MRRIFEKINVYDVPKCKTRHYEGIILKYLRTTLLLCTFVMRRNFEVFFKTHFQNKMYKINVSDKFYYIPKKWMS